MMSSQPPTSPASAANPANSDLPLRSVHTNTFVQVLNQLGISLVVSTYQAGKLIVMRADGDAVNTHFRQFQKPMGIAANRDRIALGTGATIWELHNIPNTAARLQPAGKHDACYIPRQIHVTGDIDIHEMAWGSSEQGNELWFLNTRFSCLCTLDKQYSFVPRWKPSFISAYDLRDRCHLNGLAMRDGKPRYVTALGETDDPGGWRSNKASGGILVDIETNEILLRGLSMPHSPRWYDGKLWVLESGKGSLAYLDNNSGTLVTVAQLPGFTRGIEFYGNLAFIGLSQIRESAVFSGLPLTQSLTERICGVWVVDIRSGETIAFLKFEDAVQEIFAVSVLPGIRFPEILDWSPELMGTSYVLPDEALANTVTPSDDWEFAETHFAEGNELHGQGKFEEAIACYRKCLELQPTYLPARYNLGVTLGDLERYAEAEMALKQVIDAEARHADACNSLGFVYSKQRKLEEAIAYYEQAVKVRPDFAKAHHNLGMTLLQMGDYQRGWTEAEWRWQTDTFTPFNAPHPRWDGSPMPGKTLLIHTEQGAGDTIQFIRYIPLVAEQCGKIIFVCPPELIPIFEEVEGIDDIRTAGEISSDAFDTYIALMSLPHVFQTRLDSIPNQVPYLKVPTAGRSSLITWLQEQKQTDKLQVGIVWAGSPTHSNGRHRSCALTDFLPVLRVSNAQFYSLQVGDRANDVSLLLPPEVQVVDLSPRLGNYGDTAAAIEQLDLVISVDTSVTHLVGALGKPAWTMLCYNSDWRWLVDQDNSPWYPTMRLFRQPQPGDWASVFSQAAQALTQFRK
ncbi:MAG: TIGR03032 family protein [Cyanobacteria bacterium P01_F01_bin.150]